MAKFATAPGAETSASASDIQALSKVITSITEFAQSTDGIIAVFVCVVILNAMISRNWRIEFGHDSDGGGCGGGDGGGGGD